MGFLTVLSSLRKLNFLNCWSALNILLKLSLVLSFPVTEDLCIETPPLGEEGLEETSVFLPLCLRA